jgi:hypothetical protein
MTGVYESETAPCGVANLANSPAISCDPRLAGDHFESHSRSPRINQRFLNITRESMCSPLGIFAYAIRYVYLRIVLRPVNRSIYIMAMAAKSGDFVMSVAPHGYG